MDKPYVNFKANWFSASLCRKLCFPKPTQIKKDKLIKNEFHIARLQMMMVNNTNHQALDKPFTKWRYH
jgi:hypothetical protein